MKKEKKSLMLLLIRKLDITFFASDNIDSLFIFHFRALSFIMVFLQEVLTGEEDLTKCAKKAYEETLKKYHGWMVQSIFSVCLLIYITASTLFILVYLIYKDL